MKSEQCHYGSCDRPRIHSVVSFYAEYIVCEKHITNVYLWFRAHTMKCPTCEAENG